MVLPMVTFTSCILEVKPLPVSVISVPAVPISGDIEARVGVSGDENVKEHILLEQLEGTLFSVTDTYNECNKYFFNGTTSLLVTCILKPDGKNIGAP